MWTSRLVAMCAVLGLCGCATVWDGTRVYNRRFIGKCVAVSNANALYLEYVDPQTDSARRREVLLSNPWLAGPSRRWVPARTSWQMTEDVLVDEMAGGILELNAVLRSGADVIIVGLDPEMRDRMEVADVLICYRTKNGSQVQFSWSNYVLGHGFAQYCRQRGPAPTPFDVQFARAEEQARHAEAGIWIEGGKPWYCDSPE